MNRTDKYFSILALCMYSTTLYNIYVRFENPGPGNIEILRFIKKYRLCFLSNWTYMIQAGYFGIRVAVNFLSLVSGNEKLRNKLVNISSFISTTITTPSALFISGFFWSIYLIDRELIYPRIIERMMPPWINYSVHLGNTLAALGDLYFVNHKYFSWKTSLKSLIFYLLTYGVCLFGIYFYKGHWLYPLLNFCSWSVIIGLSLVTLIMTAAVGVLARYISSILWRSPESRKKVKIGTD